jgi:hypothetical protein
MRVNKSIQTFFGKLEEKKTLGKTWRRWGDNIRMDATEIGCEIMNLIHLVQDRDLLQSLVEPCNETSGAKIGR